MRIEVTADDIAMGQRGSCCKCPIALAVARALKLNGMVVDVNGLRVFVGAFGRPRRVYGLPENARAFVDAFDAGRATRPFEFELEEAA